MQIDRSEFGSITIDGNTYEHDVVIRLSGKVDKRQKKLSKEQYVARGQRLFRKERLPHPN